MIHNLRNFAKLKFATFNENVTRTSLSVFNDFQVFCRKFLTHEIKSIFFQFDFFLLIFAIFFVRWKIVIILRFIFFFRNLRYMSNSLGL